MTYDWPRASVMGRARPRTGSARWQPDGRRRDEFRPRRHGGEENVGITVGICGAGQFARSFIPLFQAHPQVEEVRLAEVIPERRAREAARFGIARTYASLDELCDSDVDAIAIFTQRWMHGPQAVQALRAGKHVYCAVPAAITLDEVRELVRTVEETGLIYMTGETSYYYPVTLYCRERWRRGDFGDFVYAEAEYLHGMSHGFYEAYQYSGGPEW